MATQTDSPTSTPSSEVPSARTVTYRGPTVLAGALAHLLRAEGLEFEQPRVDRRVVAEKVEVVLAVRAGDNVVDRTLDDMIETALSKFRKRFGEDSTSVDGGKSHDPR